MTRAIVRFGVFLAVLCAAAPIFAASFSSTTSGNWSSAATWGGAGVPGSGDTATVNGGHVVTLDVPVSVATLTLGGGQINGTQSIAVTSTFNWNSGTLSGGGNITITGTATATLNGAGTLDTRTFSNAGILNISAANYFYMQNGAGFTNNGTVNFLGDGGIYLNGGASVITNNSTIQKSGGTGVSNITVPVNALGGSVLAQSGTLNVAAVTSTGGTFSASSGATLDFNTNDTRSFDATSTISGAGTVQFASGTNTVNGTVSSSLTVSGGTLNLNNASTQTIPALVMAGGTLGGTAPIALTAPSMTWTGGTIAGSGLLSIPVGTTVTLSGYVYFDTRALSNAGTMNYSSSYYSYFYNSATLANSGTIDFQGDGGFYIGSGSPSVTNSGTIKKSAGAGQAGIQVALTAQSGSQVQAQSGTFGFGAIASTGASFSVSSGATISFIYGNTRTFDAASSIAGTGTVDFNQGTNTVNGTYNVTGTTKNSGATTTIGANNITAVGDLISSGGSLTLTNTAAPTLGNITVQGGTLTLNIASTLTVPLLTISGGTLAGTAPITLTGAAMTWTGGTIAGSGLLTIPGGTTITFNGYVYFDTRPITSGGTLNYSSSYYSYFYNGATLTNNGTVDFQGDGGFYIGSGSPSVINNGLIKKSAGSGQGGMQVALTAQGGSQLQVQSGTMIFGQVTSSGGAFTVSSGAVMTFYYGNTRTFDAASSISGAGMVEWYQGTNTVGAAYNLTGTTKNSGATTTISNITSVGALLVSAGTLTLDSVSALSVPTLTMQGGTLNGTAPIGVTAAAMTWSGGTIGGSGQLTIPGGTTITAAGSFSFDTRPVSNAGTINYTGPHTTYYYNGAVLTNAASGIIDMQGDAGFYIGSGSPSIVNGGIIKKSAGTGSGAIQVAMTLQSGGQLQIQSGTLLLGNITSTGGTLTVSTGAFAYFYYTTTSSFDAASTVSGAGTMLFGAGTNTVSGTYNVTGLTKSTGGATTIGTSITAVGDLLVSGGTLTLNKATAINVPTLTMQGGVLNGTAPINLTGAAMTWSGGTIGGTGQLTVNAGTTVTDSSITLDARPISNGGIINLTGTGATYLQNGAVLTNSGTIDMQGDGSIYQNTGAASIINTGIIKKSAGTSGSSFSVPLTMQSGGQLLVQANILYLGNVTSTGATLDVSSGATAWFYYTSSGSFDAASTISGAGTLQLNAGTITISATYNVTGATKNGGATTTIGTAITSTGAITVSGGTLTLNSAGAISAATLTMQGGTLNGTAPINLTGPASTWSGGVIGGSGTLAIPLGTTITIAGGTYFDARPVTNAGTMNFTSTNYMYMQNNAVLTNSGTIDFQGDSSLYLNGPAGTTAVVNAGTIKKSAGASGSSFSVALTMQSGSQFLVQSSIVYFGNITSTGATLNVSSGATAYFYYTATATFDAASTITGAGTLLCQAGTNSVAGSITTSITMTGGSLALNSASTLTIPTLTMQGGTLGGTANINLTSAAMTWSGGTVGGGGALSIPLGTTITIGGGLFLDARQVTNAGTIRFTSTNYLYMQNSAVLTNSGTIDFQGDSSLYLNTGTASVVNGGTIKKSAGSTGSNFTVPLTMQSGSQFLIQAAIVYLGGTLTSTGATFNVSSGATMWLYYSDTRTFDAASTITGAGTLECSNGTNTVSGSVTTSILMTGGTLNLNSASALTIPTLTMQGGTLGGTANISLTSAAMTWSGGTIGGGGALSIPNGTTITVSGGLFLDARQLTNAGTVNFASTNYMYMQNNAVLTNSGTIEFLGDGSLYLNTGTASVVNSGTIRKSGGSSGGYFTVPLTMQGGSQFLIQAATVYFGGTLTANGGTLGISSGATAYFNYNDTRTFAAAATISGAGTLQVGSGTNTISGTLSTAVVMSGGTLTVNSAGAQSIPTLTMNGGTFNGSANVNLTGTAMTWTGGTLGGSGTLTIPSGTTVTVSGVPFIDARPVTNGGAITFTSTYYMYLQNGAALTNNGTIDFPSDNSLLLNTGAASIVNNGFLSKSGGTGTSSISVPFTNAASGTLKSSTGTIALSGGLTNGGTLSFSASSATVFGKISLTSALTFAGTLAATTSGGYTPVNGTTFQVLTFPSHSGSFTTKFLSYTGGTFTDSSTATALTLTAGPSSCFAAPANIISLYKGEGNANDSSGPNNATLSGGATTTTGKVGAALSFNGSSAYASAPNDPSMQVASITLEGWINFSAIPGTLAGIAGKTFQTGFFDSYAMWYDPSGTLRAEIADAGGEMQVTAPFSPSTSTWYHVAFTFDSASQVEKLYLNGVQVGTATYSGRQIAYDAHPLVIGADIQSEAVQFFFPGQIDELTLYSRALSGSEVQAIFNADATGKCYVPPSSPSISTVTPGSGPVSGGTSVTIIGTGLDSAGSITFGGSAAMVTARSATSLTVTTPAHSAGSVSVDISNPGGSASSAGAFTYVAAPVVGGFSPSFGPSGTSVLISGSGFTSATAVTFNGTSASFVVNNDSQITATVPSGTSSGVITVTNAAGSSSSAASFVVSSASKLAVISINGGVNPKKGNPFSVTVQSQNASSVASNVVSSTTVTLTLATGTGTLGGTLSGIINAGANTATISGVNYSVAESGVSVTATAGGGDPLTSATSATFIVDPPPSSYTVTNTNDAGSGTLREAITLANSGGCTPNCAINFNIAGANPQTIALASALPAITANGVTVDGTSQPGYTATPVIVLNGAAAGAGVSGIQVAANNVTIKGLVINSFTSNGIAINSGANNLVLGNYLGTDAGAATPLPNARGILIASGANNNIIGGVSGLTNLIAFNSGAGVTVNSGATGNQILGNSTHDNGGLAIDLNGDGVTANDAGDADTGGNNLQNTPVIVDASMAGTTLNVHVNVDSASVGGTGSIRVELFKADASGAEGTLKVATQCFVGNSLTNQLISVLTAPVTSGNVLVATATSYGGAICGTVNDGTSEFSAGVPVSSCSPPPVSISPPSPAICSGGNVTLDAGAGFASYSWSTGATTQTIVVAPSITTSYTVTVTDGTGCSNTASTIVSVGSNTATITPSGPTTFCSPGSVTLTASSGLSYSWSTGATTQSITVSASGNYSVIVYTAGGCVANASSIVTVYPPPSTPAITPSGPTTFCTGQNVTLSAPPGYAYLWSTGAVTQSINVTASGSYSVTVTDVYGCSASSAPTTVTVTPAPGANITPSGPTTFCAGGSVTLTANAGSAYLWYPGGQTTQSISVNTTNYYYVTVTQSGGCQATSAQTYVIVNAAPPATITPSGPTTFCTGGSVTLSAPAGLAGYSWSTGAITPSINVTTSGNYTVTVADSNGCTATSAPTAVNASSGAPPSTTITPSGPTAFCAGGSVTLTAPAGAASYAWSNGATTQAITVSAAGNYSVTVYSAGGCYASSTPTTVTVHPPPSVTVTPSGPTSFCTGGSVTLTATSGFAGYSWSNGATTQSITVGTSGNYSVTVVDGNGCSGTSTATAVSVSSSAGTVAITAPGAVDAGSSGNVASVPAGPGGTTYNWSVSNGTINSGQGTPSITFTAGLGGQIGVSIVLVSGTCTSTGNATVSIGSIADLKVTASASPNPVPSGSAVAFTVNVSNLGPNTAQNVSVSVNVAGAAFAGASGSGWSCSGSGSPVVCSMNLLPVGSATALVITATAGNGASATAAILASAASSDFNSSDNAATATAAITSQPPQCNNSAPSLAAPEDGATVSSPVALSWSASANATGYDVWASTNNNAPVIIASTSSTTVSVPLPAGSVSWYVGARFNNCPTLFSAPRAFTVAAAQSCGSAKAQLSAPLGGTVASPVAFNWQAAAQAIGYRVWVEIDGGGAQDVATTGGATSATATLTGHGVKWYVEAQFAGCPSTFSDPATFTLAAVDPCAGHESAQLVAPANNATATSSNILFDWNGVPNAAGYLVWAAVDGAPFTLIGKTADTQVDVLIPHGTVEWYVEAQFNGCPSTQSAHRIINIAAAQSCTSQPATSLAPANVTVSSGDVTFTWSAVPNAAAYEVWLGLSGATPSIVASTQTPSFHTTVAAGPLEFFIRTLFNGCDPVDSAHAQFTFTPPANCLTQTPILVAPADNALLVSPVDFSAAPVPGATQYRLFLGATPVATAATPQFLGINVPNGPVTWSIEAAQEGCTALRSANGTFTVVAPPQPCADPSVPSLRADATASDGVQYIVRLSPLPNALYEIQEATSSSFGDAAGTTSSSPQFAFTHVAPTSNPLVFHYRARSINKCNGNRSQFSDEITVTVLSSKPTNTPEANGSTPAENPQPTHYQIVIGGGSSIAAAEGTSFTATANVPWLTVTPASGVVPAAGITLNVTADPKGLPVGTNTGAVEVNLGTSSASKNRIAPRDGGGSSTTTVSVNLTQPVASTPKSGPPPDALIIPAVAHAAGINSQFQSDVRITNTAAVTVKYQLTFTPTGDGGSASGLQTNVSVEPGRTIALDDILESWFGEQSATGTLEIRPLTATAASLAPKALTGLANLTTFAASRTFNNTRSGTFGQFIPAIPFASFIGRDANTVLSLQQIAQSSAYRTNFGLVEGSGNPVTALVSIFGSDGKKLTEFTQSLNGGQHLQMNSVLATKGITVTDGRIEVKPIAGNGKLTAYASVLNNETSDPLLVSPVAVNTLGASKYVLAGVADLESPFADWQTDVRVYNAGSSTVSATATFYPQNGEAKSAPLSIAPGEVKVLDGVLANLFGVTNTGGAVQITTAASSTLVASARTYNVTGHGVYGQFIGAVTPNDGAALGTRALQLLQVEESNRYRTNIGLHEIGGKPAKVEITVVPPDSKLAASTTVDLAPNQFIQFNQFLKGIFGDDIYNARVTLRVIEGQGRITGYASVVDMQTGDPSFVQAQ